MCLFFSESLMQFRPVKFETSRKWHEILIWMDWWNTNRETLSIKLILLWVFLCYSVPAWQDAIVIGIQASKPTIVWGASKSIYIYINNGLGPVRFGCGSVSSCSAALICVASCSCDELKDLFQEDSWVVFAQPTEHHPALVFWRRESFKLFFFRVGDISVVSANVFSNTHLSMM